MRKRTLEYQVGYHRDAGFCWHIFKNGMRLMGSVVAYETPHDASVGARMYLEAHQPKVHIMCVDSLGRKRVVRGTVS